MATRRRRRDGDGSGDASSVSARAHACPRVYTRALRAATRLPACHRGSLLLQAGHTHRPRRRGCAVATGCLAAMLVGCISLAPLTTCASTPHARFATPPHNRILNNHDLSASTSSLPPPRSSWPSVPHLHGIFVAPTAATALWSEEQWRTDIRAMRAVGMTFFCLDPTARQVGRATPECPSGVYATLFPTRLGNCFNQTGAVTSPGGTVGNVLRAAAAEGMGVHLGLALQNTRDPMSYQKSGNVTALREYAWMQWGIAQELYALASNISSSPSPNTRLSSFPHNGGSPLVGFYTVIEEANTVGWFSRARDLSGHYLESLAADIKNKLSSDLAVWASPYYVGNMTRHNATDLMEPDFYGAFWEQLFRWSPHLDLIAPQDSMGAQGNSFENVTSFLSALSRGSSRAGRAIWSNVELFEVWPQSCQWPDTCEGRHPGPWQRIVQQLANESPWVTNGTLIAWEWYSCLSPNGGPDNAWANVTRQRYSEYLDYVSGH
eukprot:m.88759 g.88759  ORF g.88759 m.88759 type:complete len:492 (-) comp14954_c0_seq1:113-1588(-)